MATSLGSHCDRAELTNGMCEISKASVCLACQVQASDFEMFGITSAAPQHGDGSIKLTMVFPALNNQSHMQSILHHPTVHLYADHNL